MLCWINGLPFDPSWCGFAKTIGEVAADSLQCEKEDWHEKHTGMPRCASIYQAAKSLAFLYQQKLQEKVPPPPVVQSQPEVSVVVSQ